MKYFSVEELCKSATAKAKGLSNNPTPGIRQNLETLITKLLDPIREKWGCPIFVNSGYRSPELNKLVGGVKNSHHMLGMAADITTGNTANNRKLFQAICDMNLAFTQLIDENNFAWIHVSYDPANLKRQVLRL